MLNHRFMFKIFSIPFNNLSSENLHYLLKEFLMKILI